MTTIIDGTAGITFPAGGVGNPASAVVGLTDTQTLTNKSVVATQLTGTIAAARLPTGSVLQVVQASTYSPQTMSITSSAALVASGFTCAITPSSSSSKVLVFYSSTIGSTSSNNGVGGNVQLYRNIGGGAYGFAGGSYHNYWNTATYISYQQLSFTLMYLDSPATTSQVIYQPYFNLSCGTAGGTGVLGGRNTDGLAYSGSYIISMEITA